MMMSTLNDSLGRIQRIQMEMASGRRILKPSDDPTGTVQVLSFRRSLEEIAQFKRNISDGLRWNTATENTLIEIVDTLIRLKECATRAANESSDGLEAMGTTVNELVESLISKSRTRIDDRHLFSGFNTATEPYEITCEVEDEGLTAGAIGTEVDLMHARVAQGTVVIKDQTGTLTFVEGTDYSVDYTTGRVTVLSGSAISEGESLLVSYTTESTSSVRLAESIEGLHVRQIDKDWTLAVNLLAQDVFQGGIDLFETGISLRDALWKDDADAVGNLLASIDGAIEQVTELLGVVGTRAQSMESHSARLEGDGITLEAFISEIESTDLTVAVLQLQTEQSAYEAALAATARIMQISLINYL